MTDLISPLYLRHLTRLEKRSLRHLPQNGLASEIELLRVFLSRFLQLDHAAPLGLEASILSLHTLTMFSSCLSALISSQIKSHPPDDELGQMLAEAVRLCPFDLPPGKESEPFPCPENAAPSPATATPSSTDFTRDNSPPSNAGMSPI